MPTLLTLLVRVLLVAAGLFFALVLSCLFVLVLAVWLLRAGWAKLTGRPVTPFVMRKGPRQAFEEMMRRGPGPQASRTPRSDAAAGFARPSGDVTDVEPK
jgi:hypothetical protein